MVKLIESKFSSNSPQGGEWYLERFSHAGLEHSAVLHWCVASVWASISLAQTCVLLETQEELVSSPMVHTCLLTTFDPHKLSY